MKYEVLPRAAQPIRTTTMGESPARRACYIAKGYIVLYLVQSTTEYVPPSPSEMREPMKENWGRHGAKQLEPLQRPRIS